MKYTYTLGIDVSKKTLDCFLLQANNKVFSLKITNAPRGFNQLDKRLKKQGISPKKLLVCLEKTGLYNYLLVDFMHKQGYQLWEESALAIKKSMGLVRGKNDQIDAYRIACYAYRYQDIHTPYVMPTEAIKKLKVIASLRNRLRNTLKQLEMPLQEIKSTLGKQTYKTLSQICNSSIKTLKKDLEKANKEIEQTIQKEKKLTNLFKKITSVEGVGKVTAVHLLVITNGFTQIKTAKKMACYSGVIPFTYCSGSSIKGKTRVSPLANKQTKTLLHMAALSVVKTTGQLGSYYARKVKEGKNKMSVINAVRNKIIHRIYACVRDNRCYEKEYAKKVA